MPVSGLMRKGMLIDAKDHWVWRFYRDESAWVRDPKVFVDPGRAMPEGPPLLKERRHHQKDLAEQMWKSLQHQGWRPTKPVWGAGVEPLIGFQCTLPTLAENSHWHNEAKSSFGEKPGEDLLFR